ncbi:hypothetical protein GCK72_017577 [Caenorhabditis remanei]|uniref:Uncharacterized protein n=1 Tax=Caenorhabditis remanei TaxID=31234 RepID=A0A6A5G8I6_CAERE|nr:hypothetical protein GCK72_017577 [Caenorhabditis remanei]KAF1751025.1 hypothetical protein GCK72_017577 [Caenorhabditis remanei]
MNKLAECHGKESFFENRFIFQVTSHIISSIFLPVNCWGIYCIAKKTPKSMKPVKMYLLNLHIWSTLFDLMCGSLITPFFFFPSLSGSPSGFLTDIGIPTLVQICLTFCIFGGLCSAIIFVFENRQYVLCENTNKFRLENNSTRVVYYSFVLAYCCLSIYPFSWNIPEQKTAKLRILGIIPCPHPEFFSDNTYVFKGPEDTAAFGYFGLCFTIFLASQISFFGGNCFYMLYAFDHVTLSAYSKRLQRKFFITICIQPSFDKNEMIELLKDIIQCLALSISIVLNSVLTYLIMTKSNSKMGSYKYIMMYLSLSALCYSILGLIVRPNLRYSMATEGLCSAIIFVFENRQYVLCENTNKFRLENNSTRVVYYSFVLAYCCLSIYPFSWNIPEQKTAKLRILGIIPCPHPEFFSDNTYVFKGPEDTAAFGYFGLCFTIFLASQISFFGGNCFYMLYAFDHVTLSAYSKRLQRKFFITICIQPSFDKNEMIELLKDIIQCLALSISIVLNSVLTYLIMTKSNSKMGSYKYIMMYLSLSALCYSILGLIVRPDLLSYSSCFAVYVKNSSSFFSPDVMIYLMSFICAFYFFFASLIAVHFVYRYNALKSCQW